MPWRPRSQHRVHDDPVGTRPTEGGRPWRAPTSYTIVLAGPSDPHDRPVRCCWWPVFPFWPVAPAMAAIDQPCRRLRPGPSRHPPQAQHPATRNRAGKALWCRCLSGPAQQGRWPPRPPTHPTSHQPHQHRGSTRPTPVQTTDLNAAGANADHTLQRRCQDLGNTPDRRLLAEVPLAGRPFRAENGFAAAR